jgi:Glycosyltransferase family 87
VTRETRWKLAWDALTVSSIVAIAWVWVTLIQGDYFYDARAYWSVDVSDPYAESLVGRAGTYLYTPAFAQLIWPATLLPWPVFAAAFSALNLAALIRMTGPILAAFLLFAPLSPVRDEITTGNIHLLIALAIVLGFRHSGTWAFPILTKLTPGVGVLWFAGARAWRSLAIAAAVTAAVVGVSFVLAPRAWLDWFELLVRSSDVPVPGDIGVVPGPLWLRTTIAGLVVVAGGWLGWRWVVPVAVFVALPVTWSSGLSILVAILPIVLGSHWWRTIGRGRHVPVPTPSRAGA